MNKNPNRCFKNLAFGYEAAACKMVARIVCLRCGENGHFLRECEKEEVGCYVGKVEGHWANSRACLEYAKAPKKEKEALRKKGMKVENNNIASGE